MTELMKSRARLLDKLRSGEIGQREVAKKTTDG